MEETTLEFSRNLPDNEEANNKIASYKKQISNVTPKLVKLAPKNTVSQVNENCGSGDVHVNGKQCQSKTAAAVEKKVSEEADVGSSRLNNNWRHLKIKFLDWHSSKKKNVISNLTYLV